MKRSLIVTVVLIIALVVGGVLIFNGKQNASATKEGEPVTTAKESVASSQEATPKSSTYYGVDVSHWNGDILDDITKVDDISFGICKATEGVDYTDPDFDDNWAMLKEKGLIRGAYHFYTINDDAAKQAEFYYKTVSANPSNKQMTYIVDIEAGSLSGSVTKQEVVAGLKAFLKALENLSGKLPMIYTNSNFANEYLANSFGEYPLWLAEYSGGDKPNLPSGWGNYTIWQKSDTYDLDNTHVDYDEYNGVLSDLNKFAE